MEAKKYLLGEGTVETQLPLLTLFFIGIVFFTINAIIDFPAWKNRPQPFYIHHKYYLSGQQWFILYMMEGKILAQIFLSGYFFMLLGYLFRKFITKYSISKLATRATIVFTFGYLFMISVQIMQQHLRFFKFESKFREDILALAEWAILLIKSFNELGFALLSIFFGNDGLKLAENLEYDSIFILYLPGAIFLSLAYYCYCSVPFLRKEQKIEIQKTAQANVKFHLLFFALFQILGMVFAWTIRAEDNIDLTYFLSIFCGLVSVIPVLMLLAQAWHALEKHPNAISPKKAIGFLLIPVFSIYWIFAMLYSLAKTYNSHIKRESLRISPMNKHLLLSYPLWSITLYFTRFSIPFSLIGISITICFMIHISSRTNAIQKFKIKNCYKDSNIKKIEKKKKGKK